MPDKRIAPPASAGEHEMLTAWLDWHRETLAFKCDGLSEEQLRLRPSTPSTLSLLGLVRHMAGVERAWFRMRLNGEDIDHLYYSLENPDGEFDDVETASVGEAFSTWRAEVEAARAVSAAYPDLDTPAKREARGVTYSHRWILVHMIEEYARHNGHADLIREQIDGVTGE
ncbi:DinB family protein [Planotetraspora thailandica]|nr:DinB family protein [Planotetraspora thailandica]